MYSWGGGGGEGVGKKCPNNEKNFRIFHGIRSHDGVCYPENEDAIYKEKYAYLRTDIYRSMQYRRKLFFLGELKTRAEGPRKFLNLESLKCHFLDFGRNFDRILMVSKQSFSMSKFTICLQFSRTKWAKAYLINYILEKLQERVCVI